MLICLLRQPTLYVIKLSHYCLLWGKFTFKSHHFSYMTYRKCNEHTKTCFNILHHLFSRPRFNNHPTFIHIKNHTEKLNLTACSRTVKHIYSVLVHCSSCTWTQECMHVNVNGYLKLNGVIASAFQYFANSTNVKLFDKHLWSKRFLLQ